MASLCTISNAAITPTTVNVRCDKVLISGNKKLGTSPNANAIAPVEVNTQSVENLKFTLQGIHYTGVSGDFTFEHLLTLYRLSYDGTAATKTTLSVTYGDSSTLTVKDSSDADITDIPVVVSTFSFPIDVKSSIKGYLPVGSLTLEET